MPFSTDEFMAVFAGYNVAVWPLQILAYVAGVAALALACRGSAAAGRGVAAILAAMWVVNGIGYHWLHFARINPAAWLFGAAFLAEAALLVFAAVRRGGIRFTLRRDGRSVVAGLLVLYALVLYPLGGALAGHAYPAVPVFGIAPCPTTIFTIGLLLLAPWRQARWLLPIPLLWSATGGSAAILLAVPQDFGLIAAGLAVVAVAAVRGFGLARHEDAT